MAERLLCPPSDCGWGQDWTVVGPVQALLYFPSHLQNTQLMISFPAARDPAEFSVITAPKSQIYTDVYKPGFHLLKIFMQKNWLNEWCKAVRFKFPYSSLMYFAKPYLPSKNIIWTKPNWLDYFSSELLQISRVNICQAHAELRLTRLIQHMMHVVAKLMVFPPKSGRKQPYPPPNIPQMAISMLLLTQSNTSIPENPTRDCWKTFSKSKTAATKISVPAFWN